MATIASFYSCSYSDRLECLQWQIRHAVSSRYYARIIPSDLSIETLQNIEEIPFLTETQLKSKGKEMVCVGAGDVKRIVSLQTTGTAGERKRIYFSEEDLARTVQFFSEGMQLICSSGDKVGIIFPSNTVDGLVDLLSRGLTAFGAKPYEIGEKANNNEQLCGLIEDIKPNILVGQPRVLRQAALLHPEYRPRAVLLSGDYVSFGLRSMLSEIWHCEVFEHYGMTEAGFGCAVEDTEHNGMLPRNDELMIEIIDETGSATPDGMPGEIVLTTLRRVAMPLLRYRTGDIGIMENGRLMQLIGRKDDPLTPALADLLDKNTGIIDYNLTLHGKDEGILNLYTTEKINFNLDLKTIFPDLRLTVKQNPILNPEKLALNWEKRRTVYSL